MTPFRIECSECPLDVLIAPTAANCRAAKPLADDDDSPVAAAIRKKFPASRTHKTQQALISRRYRRLYDGMTEEEAVAAVMAGHSSPAAAITPRVSSMRYVQKLAMATDDAAGRFITETRFFIKMGAGPARLIRDLDSLAAFVRLRNGNEIVIEAARATWRRYQLWIGD